MRVLNNFFILSLDVVGDRSCIKFIDILLHFFAKFLFSGYGRSTIIKPSTPEDLQLLKNYFHHFDKLS